MYAFKTYATTTSSTTATATTAATSPGGSTATVLSTASTLRAATRALSVSLRSAGKLDRDLALENSLSVQLGDGALSLGRRRERNEGISDWARGARVGGNGDGLAVG